MNKEKTCDTAKSERIFRIFSTLQSVYEGVNAISEAEMKILAERLEDSINAGFSAADICATVTDFWQMLLWSKERNIAVEDIYDWTLDEEVFDIEVDSELAKEWEITEEIIELLEVNEKQAHALYESFTNECNLYSMFERLATDFREFLTAEELTKVFKTAECFDKELVDCYRDD